MSDGVSTAPGFQWRTTTMGHDVFAADVCQLKRSLWGTGSD